MQIHYYLCGQRRPRPTDELVSQKKLPSELKLTCTLPLDLQNKRRECTPSVDTPTIKLVSEKDEESE